MIGSFVIATYMSANIGYGIFRRLLPCFCLAIWFMSLAIDGLKYRWSKVAMGALCVAALSFQSYALFRYVRSSQIDWVFCSDLVEAATWVNGIQNSNSTIAFSSYRWPVLYETFKYVAGLNEKNWDAVDITTSEQLSELIKTHKSVIGIFFPERRSLLTPEQFAKCENRETFIACMF